MPISCRRRSSRTFASSTVVDSNSSSSNDGQLVSLSHLERLVDQFPPVSYAFGYGSGVFAQTKTDRSNSTDDTTTAKPTMVDVLLVVQNAETWHAENLLRHSQHYSAPMRWLGAKECARVQRVGAGVYFHPMVVLSSGRKDSCSAEDDDDDAALRIKYGVVETTTVAEDLRDWTHLYVAGRLHKPTVTIQSTDNNNDDDLRLMLELQHQHNLPAALAAALIQLGGTDYNNNDNDNNDNNTTTINIPYPVLFQQIAQLSYSGDIRMTVGGEDPNKIRNLVHAPGQLERFRCLYSDSLQTLHRQGVIDVKDQAVEWNPREAQTQAFLRHQCLPRRLRTISNAAELTAQLQKTVARSAWKQSVKGLVTAGVTRSAVYAARKLAKGGWRV